MPSPSFSLFHGSRGAETGRRRRATWLIFRFPALPLCGVRRNRIHAEAARAVALANPFQAEPDPPDHPPLHDRFRHIAGTGGVVAAALAEKRRECNLI